MAVIYFIPKRKTATLGLHLGGREVTFRLTTLEATGAAVMLASSDDVAVLRQARRMGYVVLDEAPAEDARPGLAVTEASPRTTPDGWRYPAIVNQAFANGWKYEDCTGAGTDNLWGVEGGRGLKSGLTMAELSLTVPPEGWQERRETHWPWEILGWRAPGEDWRAPVLPSKRPAADAVPEADEPPAPLEDEPPADEPPARGDSLIDDDLDDPPPVETRNDELLADWAPERRDQAVGVLEEVWRKAGKAPTTSKARYHLQKAGIAPVTTEQVNALLDLVQSSID